MKKTIILLVLSFSVSAFAGKGHFTGVPTTSAPISDNSGSGCADGHIPWSACPATKCGRCCLLTCENTGGNASPLNQSGNK